jgi:ketopantoate hydroxymethyltransferase
MTRVTTHSLRAQKAAGDKICMLTAYDATFARLVDEAGVDVILVGDSLGMVMQGHPHTLAGHARAHGLSRALRRARHPPRPGGRRHAVHERTRRASSRACSTPDA